MSGLTNIYSDQKNVAPSDQMYKNVHSQMWQTIIETYSCKINQKVFIWCEYFLSD